MCVGANYSSQNCKASSLIGRHLDIFQLDTQFLINKQWQMYYCCLSSTVANQTVTWKPHNTPSIVLVNWYYLPGCQDRLWRHGGIQLHSVAPRRRLLGYSAKGHANVSGLIVLELCARVHVCCLAPYSWSCFPLRGIVLSMEKVLVLKAADTLAVTEEALDSSQAPARPPAFTLTSIQTEKTTRSRNTNSATWGLPPSPAGN